jgi:hypothetical protein
MISTLPSLRQQTPQEIEGILANLTLGLLPNPGVGSNRYEPDITPEFHQRLIQEIRVSLRLKRDDKSPQAMAKIYEYLAHEIERAALMGVDISEVKTRLGERGDLAPSLYKIEFTDTFRNLSETRGIEKRDVEQALRAPDFVQHLRPELLGIATAKLTSLYLKEFKNSQHPSNTYSLLVFCHRSGYVQKVGEAWRIFPSDVDTSTAKSPLDVLKAFVNKYGLEIEVGDRKGLFFWHEHVARSQGSNSETNLIRFNKIDPTIDMSTTFEVGKLDSTGIEIFYAFSINHTAYDADLAKHGFRIKPSKHHAAKT